MHEKRKAEVDTRVMAKIERDERSGRTSSRSPPQNDADQTG
jgi:hypothetical protein